MPQFLPVGHTEAGVSGGHLGTYTLGYSWESRRQSEGRWAEAWPWDSTSPPDRSTQAPVPRGAHRPGRSTVWREGSLAGGGTASFPARTSQEQHGAQRQVECDVGGIQDRAQCAAAGAPQAALGRLVTTLPDSRRWTWFRQDLGQGRATKRQQDEAPILGKLGVGQEACRRRGWVAGPRASLGERPTSPVRRSKEGR